MAAYSREERAASLHLPRSRGHGGLASELLSAAARYRRAPQQGRGGKSSRGARHPAPSFGGAQSKAVGIPFLKIPWWLMPPAVGSLRCLFTRSSEIS